MQYRSVQEFLDDVNDVLARGRFEQRELAEELDVPESQVSRWLTGVSIPRLDSAIRIQLALLAMCAKAKVPRYPIE